MAKKKETLILHYGLLDDFEYMTKEQIADLIIAIFRYEIYGERPEFKDKLLYPYFQNISRVLDSNKEKYQEMCERNRVRAKSRWEGNKKVPPAYSGIKIDAKNADNDNEKDKDNVKDNDNEYVNDEDCLSEDESSAAHTHKKQYGIFSNISLDDGQYEQIRQLFPNDYQQRIDSMSSYMKAQGKTYKDDFARLCSWNLFDRKEEKPKKDNSPSYDIDAYMQQAINLEYKKIN